MIVHEYLNMKVPNQSKLFKSLMRIHMLNWEKQVAKMREEAQAKVQASVRFLSLSVSCARDCAEGYNHQRGVKVITREGRD